MCAARPCLEKGGHPRLTSLLPPGPVSFPRNDWSSHNPPPWVFPPYHRADSTHTMLWAARGASEQWYNVVSALSLHGHVAPRQVSVKLLNSIVASSPILSKTKLRHIKSAESTDKLLLAPLATPLHLFGGSPIDFDVPPASTICNTIFALAVVDKVLEINKVTYVDFRHLRNWQLYTDGMAAIVYEMARSALPPIIPCPPFDTVRPTIRVALDHCYCGIYGAEKWPKEDRPPIDLDSFAVSIPTGFLKNQRTGPDVVVGYCPTIDVAITFGDLQQMVEPRARKPRSGKKDPRKVAESLAVRMHKLRLEDK